jgi:predicted nucleic acid-binding protein
MIVADNTLLCHYFLRSELGAIARQVREKDGDWIVPSLWRAEFANAIVKAYWAHPDPAGGHLLAWDNAFAVMAPCERAVDFHAVIRLGAEKRISAYDAHYAHLALKYRVPLVTEDVRLHKTFPETAVTMANFLGSERSPGKVRERRAAYRVGQSR